MHHNELFESHSNEEGVVLKDIGDVYKVLDVGLHDRGYVKDKDRTQITSKVAISKAISSIVKNISGAHAYEIGDSPNLNVHSSTQTSNGQDSSSFDVSDLSSSKVQ